MFTVLCAKAVPGSFGVFGRVSVVEKRHMRDCVVFSWWLIRTTFLPFRLPHVTGDSLTGTVHACFAYVLYAQWLSDNVRAGESTSIHCNELYQRLALSLGQSRLAGEIRRQLEAAVLRTWKHQKVGYSVQHAY